MKHKILKLSLLGLSLNAFSATSTTTATLNKIKKSMSAALYNEFSMSRNAENKYDNYSGYQLLNIKSKLTKNKFITLRNEFINTLKHDETLYGSMFYSVALQFSQKNIIKDINNFKFSASARLKRYLHSSYKDGYAMLSFNTSKEITQTVTFSGYARYYQYILKPQFSVDSKLRELDISNTLSKSLTDKVSVDLTALYVKEGLGLNSKEEGSNKVDLSLSLGYQVLKNVSLGTYMYVNNAYNFKDNQKNLLNNAYYAVNTYITL